MGLFDIFGGAITSAWSSAAHDESQEIMNQRNIEFQRETNKMNEQLWREKFDYDKWQYLNTLAYNSKEAREAFEREAKWNSPLNQVAELRKAGINPFSVFGQNGSVAAAHSSPASGANNSSSAPPQMIAPQMQYSYQNSGLAASLQMVDAVTKVIDSLSSSKLKGSQKKEIDTLLGDKLAQLKAQTQNEEALAQINKLEVSFKQTFGMLEADARYQKLVAEASDLWQSIALKISQGELIDEQKLTEQSKRMLNDIEGQLKGEQKRLFKLQADNYLIVQAQNIKESNSRITSNYASAEQSTANADYQNSTRQRLEKLLPNEISIQEIEKEAKEGDPRTLFKRLLGYVKDKSQFAEDYWDFVYSVPRRSSGGGIR